MSDECQRVGQAYLEAIQDDPDAQAALKRVQDMFGGIAAVVASASEQTIEAVKESDRAVGEKLAAAGFRAPQTLDDWMQLAREVEKEPGPMTLDDIYNWALAWASRERLRAAIQHEVRASQEQSVQNPPDPPVLDPDGPYGQNLFRCRGKSVSLQPLPWRLLSFMWGKGPVLVETVVSGVWGQEDVSSNAIKSAIRKVNRLLTEAGHIPTLSTMNGNIYWQN